MYSTFKRSASYKSSLWSAIFLKLSISLKQSSLRWARETRNKRSNSFSTYITNHVKEIFRVGTQARVSDPGRNNMTRLITKHVFILKVSKTKKKMKNMTTFKIYYKLREGRKLQIRAYEQGTHFPGRCENNCPNN
jgi:hypothetical protein